MATVIRFRRNTAEEAAENNLILAAGEPGFELDTNVLKVGDGVRSWADLPKIGEGAAGLIVAWNELAPDVQSRITDRLTKSQADALYAAVGRVAAIEGDVAAIEDDVAALEGSLSGKLGKLGAGQATQVYARNSSGQDTGIGYSGNALPDTFPIRDGNGRMTAADPASEGHVATKRYVDETTPRIFDGNVITPPQSAGAVGTWAPESTGFTHIPHLFNDLAFNTLRGGTITVTKNGSPFVSSSDVKVFEPNVDTLSIPVESTDVVVAEVACHTSFRYGTVLGVAMSTSFRAKNIQIEAFYNDTWNAVETRTNNTTGVVVVRISVPTTATAGLTRLRYTFRDFHNTAFRISSLFCLAYNSPLLESSFMTLKGGRLLGPLTYTADPVAADQLSRKAYVDTKVAKQSGSTRVYVKDTSGNDASVPYSSSATAQTFMFRTADGVTSVGDPTDGWHATNKRYVDGGLATKADAAALAGKADLVGGVVPVSQLPRVAIGETFTAASEAAMLALDAQPGDVAIRTDIDTVYMMKAANPAALASWFDLSSAAQGGVVSVNGQTGTVFLGKGDVGLGNVDNTSDAAKPISTATAQALAGKVNTSDARLTDRRAPLDQSVTSNSFEPTVRTAIEGAISKASTALQGEVVATLPVNPTAGRVYFVTG
ncbi:minor tail protein [Gordonia phage Dardanus]|uniref:Minor tail protein n=1 Tax=Gordonia phage Dardanus TaxID=2588489 RepID=A0A514CX21_9CAUD|nr:minor tail protein [Gordonia phage Dardanus]QDH85066.1 minor tail protein [Gordonia phage Dardanus]